MSIVTDTFFGGAEKKAAKAQTKALKQGQQFTREATEQARADINNIFPQAQLTGQQGFQAALDVFGQSLPAQTNTFQQGNVGAQQAILSGLPQMQNALFGNQVDFSQMQPFEMQTTDLGFFNQQLPQITQRLAEEEAVAARNQAFIDNNLAKTSLYEQNGWDTSGLYQGGNSGNFNATQGLGGNAEFFNQNINRRIR
tara:strand:+ start:6445 stop:7035 length:591 start_codon:yes stop_codon:yes gene_type:complete